MKKGVYSFIILVALLIGGIYLFQKNAHTGHSIFNSKEEGSKIDSLNGVYVYYNGHTSNISGRNTAPDGYNLGLKYQCVEFVKRYYYQFLKHKMPNSYGNARDFFDHRLRNGDINKERGLVQFKNFGREKPKANDIVVFKESFFNPYGHVAIVTRVTNSKIEIIQQNPGIFASSRKSFQLLKEFDKWKVADDRLLGWLRKK